MPMDFKTAKNATVPFGKHKGKTIDQLAKSNRGLGYLDWLMGLTDLREGYFKEALHAYMSDASIQKELTAIRADREHARQQWER